MRETFYTFASSQFEHEYKIALLSDTHDTACDEILNSLHKQKPDYILIAGDFLQGNIPENDCFKMQDTQYALEMLEQCAKTAPTYLSLGNHEWMLIDEDIDIIQKTGVTVLDNAFIKTGPFVIGGLSAGNVLRYRRLAVSPSSRNHRYKVPSSYLSVSLLEELFPKKHEVDPEFLPDTSWLDHYAQEPGYHILLSHHPEYWTYPPVHLSQLPIELILSGHAHGGQCRYYSLLEGTWRGLYAPNQGLFPKYTSGVHIGNSTMVISRGLSNTAKVIPRLFNPIEMVYLSLIPESL